MPPQPSVRGNDFTLSSASHGTCCAQEYEGAAKGHHGKVNLPIRLQAMIGGGADHRAAGHPMNPKRCIV
jgi:hypothetical protein